MPLLHKKPFNRKRPPTNIKPDDKVFYCELSNEIFTNYDEFWERLVLLNALVWSCEITGRPNLTFKEALDSEMKAKKFISNVPTPLKVPILYCAYQTRRTNLADMNEDVFGFIRDRYFLNEELEAIVSNHWYDCKVTDIMLPTGEQVAKYNKDMAESDSESVKSIEAIERDPLAINGVDGFHEDDDDIIILRDDHQEKDIGQILMEYEKENEMKEENEAYPPFATIRYKVEEIEPWDRKSCKCHVVTWEQIKRTKGVFTREKCKVFLKSCITLSADGYLSIKDALINKYRINKLDYTDLFVGVPPKFQSAKPRSLVKAFSLDEKRKDSGQKKIKKRETASPPEKSKKKEATQSEDNEKKPLKNIEKKIPKMFEKKASKMGEKKDPLSQATNSQDPKIPPIQKEPIKTEEEKQRERERIKEEWRLKMEKLRAEKKRKKDLEREEKWLMSLCISEWNNHKEDLECGDHKELPNPQPVLCRIPECNFGEFLMVLEFVNSFSELLELKDVYPHGITFDMLEHAVVENEVAGIFNDILQLLLGAIFSLQEEEEEEIQADHSVDAGNLDLETHLDSKDLKMAVSLANKASTYCQQYLNIPLQKAPLDALTLTEILRLHLLSSGATNVTNANWRMMYRGGFRSTDDPGLKFKVDEPELIKQLTISSVFELTTGDKMKIMNVLICQILTYVSVRDSIDDKLEKLKELRNTLRLHKFAENRMYKEEKKEQYLKKQKLREEKLKNVVKSIENVTNTILAEGESSAKPEAATNGLVNGDDAMTEEERLAQEEKDAKQRERRKQDSQKKEKSLVDQLAKLQRAVSQRPLGQDRAHRRYWLTMSVPAFFVEDGYGNVGACSDKPTPVGEKHPSTNEKLKSQVKNYASKSLAMKEKEKSLSNKENLGGTQNQQPPPMLLSPAKKLLKEADGNISVNVKKDSSNTANISENRDSAKTNLSASQTCEFDIDDFLESIDLFVYNSDNVNSVPGLCSGDPSSCFVHTESLSRPKWSFFTNIEDIEALINSLNERGIRESELKENLISSKVVIEEALRNCPAYKMDPSQEPDLSVGHRKSQRGAQQSSPNLNFPPNTPIPQILETTLRDMVLEIEEKIDNGMLGRLKVPERVTWRISISESASSTSYISPDLEWGGRKRILEFKSNLGLETKEEETESLDLMAEVFTSETDAVRDLSIAILMTGQAVDSKYLKAPLVDSDKLQKSRTTMMNRMRKMMKKELKTEGQDVSSSSDEDDSFDEKTKKLKTISNNNLRTPFEKWEVSLMTSTSFSQLYLRLALLDNSITWSRSALNTRCSLCRRKSDPENMLLCDECDRGYHMYCLKPKLKAIPSGDWFCDKCNPKEKPKTPRLNRKVYTEESDEEEEQESEAASESEEERQSVPNMEYCFACDAGGELICCDTCPKSFHAECLEMRKIPRGSWSCPLCRETKAQNKRKSHGGASKSSNDKSKGDKENGKKRSFEKVEEEPFHKTVIEDLLTDLSAQKCSWPFVKPVFKVDCPDYYNKIKKPMDFRTMKNRMAREKYTSDTEFIADVLLIIQNCQQYYKDDSPECEAAGKLSKYFWTRVKKLGLHSNEQPIKQPAKKRRR